jgi:hypothetical protein
MMNSFLAILIIIIQLVSPLFPAGNFQAQGSISANGIPVAYQATLNTENQTIEMDLKAIVSTVFRLVADSNGIVIDGDSGRASYSTEDFLHDLDQSLEHRTGKELSWDTLRQYIINGTYSEDIQTVLRWLGSVQTAKPDPDMIEENGVTYYQVDLNTSDILAIITGALDSLTTPSQAAQELAQLHIWDALGIEAAPNLRYLRYLIDQLSNKLWNNSTLYWLYQSNFHLVIKWPDDTDSANTTLLPFPLPSEIYMKATFDDHGDPVVWDIQSTEGELKGTVSYGDLQTLAFSLVDSQNDVTLNVDFCVYDQEHYHFTMKWCTDENAPSLQANLTKRYKDSAYEWYDIPLLSVKSSSNEITINAHDEHYLYVVQGSIYWLHDQYYLNIRLKDRAYSSAETYEIHAEADTSKQETSLLSVNWSCGVFSEYLDQKAQYSGIFDCFFTAASQSELGTTTK